MRISTSMAKVVTTDALVHMRSVRKMLFAIIVDETTDCSHQEQFAVFIRFCTSQLEINEVFVGFYEIEKQDAATLLKESRS